MNLIKTYLLPIALVLFFSMQVFTQPASANDGQVGEEEQVSGVDSVLVNCYFSEAEYNKIHGINQSEMIEDSDQVYGDEIYGDQKHRKSGRNTFWEDVPADLIFDVVVNTLFFVAILWQ